MGCCACEVDYCSHCSTSHLSGEHRGGGGGHNTLVLCVGGLSLGKQGASCRNMAPEFGVFVCIRQFVLL